MFKPGDIVEVINWGACYGTYEQMAQILGLTNWAYGRLSYKGFSSPEFKVIATAPHSFKTMRICVGVEDPAGKQYIFDHEGLKLKQRSFKPGDIVYHVAYNHNIWFEVLDVELKQYPDDILVAPVLTREGSLTTFPKMRLYRQSVRHINK